MDDSLVQGLVTGSLAATDTLSPFSLFLQADLVVKAVILVLLVASVMSWAIIFDKWRRMRRLNRDAGRFEELFWSVASLEDLHAQTNHQDRDPMSSVFGEAMLELQGSFGSGTLRDAAARDALQARVERVMTVEAGRWMDRIERHMMFLASVGSVSPFIGLFGTVWGIMNSFAAIAASKQTNLAVVAPGIAEALFATALGWSPQSRRSSPTTSSPTTSPATGRGSTGWWPTSSPSPRASFRRPGDMAAPLGGPGRSGRRYRPMSEINVTPLVDVMLVLLVVFMITAPLLTVGVPVDLPETEAAQLTDRDEPLVVSVDAEGKGLYPGDGSGA